MTHRLRNFSVGITVLTGLIVLAWMIVKFGAAPATFFKAPQIKVMFHSDRGDGLGDGSNITYKGIAVGRVMSVERAKDDTILIAALIDKDPPLPANIRADIIFNSPLGGVSALDLKLDGPPSATQLAEGAQLEARYLGSTFLPPEFADLARNLNESVKQFNDSKVIEKLTLTIDTTQKRIEETKEVIAGLNTLVNDAKVRDDLKASIANIKTTSENATEITNKIRALTDKFTSIADHTDKATASAEQTLASAQKRLDHIETALTDQLASLGKVLDDVHSITSKVDKGQGTAGLLVNDPKLYQSLVDSMKKVDGTMATVQRLVEQWEQEGLTLRLGK